METSIKNNLMDITYMAELIPPAFLRKQEGGINSHNNLRTLCVRKLCAH